MEEDEEDKQLLLQKEGEQDEDSCPICWNSFSFPISLCCGHNICGPCIGGYISSINIKKQKTNLLKCPICKAPFHSVSLHTNELLARKLGIKCDRAKNFGRDFESEQPIEYYPGILLFRGEEEEYRLSGAPIEKIKRLWKKIKAYCKRENDSVLN